MAWTLQKQEKAWRIFNLSIPVMAEGVGVSPEELRAFLLDHSTPTSMFPPAKPEEVCEVHSDAMDAAAWVAPSAPEPEPEIYVPELPVELAPFPVTPKPLATIKTIAKKVPKAKKEKKPATPARKPAITMGEIANFNMSTGPKASAPAPAPAPEPAPRRTDPPLKQPPMATSAPVRKRAAPAGQQYRAKMPDGMYLHESGSGRVVTTTYAWSGSEKQFESLKARSTDAAKCTLMAII